MSMVARRSPKPQVGVQILLGLPNNFETFKKGFNASKISVFGKIVLTKLRFLELQETTRPPALKSYVRSYNFPSGLFIEYAYFEISLFQANLHSF